MRRESPILFSGEMVRAILAGRKSQTRRVVKGVALQWVADGMFTPEYVALCDNGLSPYGYAGDRLWVRETFVASPDGVIYRATESEHGINAPDDSPRWKPSIFMPRQFSRLKLEVIGVRVERLHAITKEDAEAEGVVTPDSHTTVRGAFQELWNRINEKRGYGWDKNPWVWVISFKRVEPSPPHLTEQPAVGVTSDRRQQ